MSKKLHPLCKKGGQRDLWFLRERNATLYAAAENNGLRRAQKPQAFFCSACWSKNLSAMAPCVAAPPARSAAAISDASTTSSRVAPAACAALGVGLHTIGALRRAGDRNRDQLPVFSWNRAILTPDD